jgi:hypothetical protein
MAKRGLQGTESAHLKSAKAALDSAWSDLESLPPTCEGGIQRAASAMANAARASAHLEEVNDPALRATHTELFGLRNMANSASWTAVGFFSQVCKAPHREAADRPTFSRAKAIAMMKKMKRRT